MVERVTSYKLYCRSEDHTMWYYFENVSLERALVETLRIANIFERTPYIDLAEDCYNFKEFSKRIEESFPDEVATGEMTIIKWKDNQLSYTIELEGVDYPCERR